MASVTENANAYQSLADIRDRVDYDGQSLFDDNEQLRFDKLLKRLETESRKIFETLWGDVTPLKESAREETLRPGDESAILLEYPVNDITEVERKVALSSDWQTVDSDWYDYTEHRLVLAQRPTINTLRSRITGNYAAVNTRRAGWGDIAAKLRVTYDRGFGSEPPADIKSLQIAIINRMLRKLRQEQSMAGQSPEELAGAVQALDDVVNEDIRTRIMDVTSPGGATLSL